MPSRPDGVDVKDRKEFRSHDAVGIYGNGRGWTHALPRLLDISRALIARGTSAEIDPTDTNVVVLASVAASSHLP